MSRKSEIETIFGTVVRRHRQRLGISQEKLAERAKLDRTYISQIERGVKSPSLKALVALAKALDVQLHKLIREMENELDVPE